MVLLASPDDHTRRLGQALGGATVVPVPDPSTGAGHHHAPFAWGWKDRLTSWSHDVQRAQAPSSSVVVCAWPPPGEATMVVDLAENQWEQMEANFARWIVALQLAANLCRSGGAVVLVTEQPCALDTAGSGMQTALSQGLVAFTRSLAAALGADGVRVNTVTTTLWSAPEDPKGSPPYLASFPGTIEHDVAGAVRLLLDPRACGITGWVLPADQGRTW